MILAIDQGTTGSRAALYDAKGKKVASAYREFGQYYPRPGWVEHDAEEIWSVTAGVIRKVVRSKGFDAERLAGIGITNQRETTVLWDRRTGKALGRAIVWQDRRTAEDCAALKKKVSEKKIRARTGLLLDPYFSATKIRWRLKRESSLRRLVAAERLCFGTIDSWLLWNLTGGGVHATDWTNASRTLLLSLRTGGWDKELLRVFGVPASALPEVRPVVSRFGETVKIAGLPAGVPIVAMVGDQQSALFAQDCTRVGEGKNTYGTGAFVVVNQGKRLKRFPEGLLATLACDARGGKAFAVEGSIFAAGSAVQWLRDGLGLIRNAGETESLARSVADNGGARFVPALAGLGAPFWNPDARGLLSGLSRGTTRAHVVRAVLEGIAHRTADVVERIGRPLKAFRADGGVTKNAFLMQFQSDLLQVPVTVAEDPEATAWGAARLAGANVGLWDWAGPRRGGAGKVFRPRKSRAWAREERRAWEMEIRRSLC